MVTVSLRRGNAVYHCTAHSCICTCTMNLYTFENKLASLHGGYYLSSHRNAVGVGMQTVHCMSKTSFKISVHAHLSMVPILE